MTEVMNVPVPCDLDAGNGQVLKLQVVDLSDEALGELDLWLRKYVIDQAYEACENLPQALREKILTDVALKVAEVTFLTPDGQRILNTMDGLAEMVYLSSRDNALTDHAVSFEKIRKLLPREGNIKKFNTAKRLATGVDSSPPAKAPTTAEPPE